MPSTASYHRILVERLLSEEKNMIETLSTDSPKIAAFKLHGKLHDEDYKTFVTDR